MLGMDHFRVELDSVQAPNVIRESSHRTSFRTTKDPEPLGRVFDRIAVTHPNLLPASGTSEEDGFIIKVEHGLAILTFDPFPDLPAQQLGHKLLSVADSKDCGPGDEDSRVNCGTSGFVYARRPTGDDDTSMALELCSRRLARQDLGIDSEFTNFPRNQVGILAASIEYGDLRMGDVIGHVNKGRMGNPALISLLSIVLLLLSPLNDKLAGVFLQRLGFVERIDCL